ncbi:MAG: amidohydrolase [Oscillospiraceae bacterium]|nr:amidohydrolase [Oscillospiraceae bacterium]
MSVLFQNVTAVLMDAAHTVLPNAFVAVDSGRITAVSSTRPQGVFDRVIDGKGGILMPGLVNCHTHVPMTAMRGYGDGHDLQTWLSDFIFPVEAKWDDRAVRSCADLGLMEMIASGVTCLTDMYMHTLTVGQAVADAGLSANLCCGGVFFGETFSPDACGDCKNQEALFEAWHGYDHGRIQVDASIHGEYTSKAGLWEWMAAFAQTHGLNMHVHVSETKKEHEECKARHGGLTPIQILNRHGVWDGPRAYAAHCVWTEPQDWAIMAEKHVTAVHNPVSNLKLGSGVAPVPELLKAGVNVALGTDGVSSNNTTDMFEDMKLSAILQNGVRHDPLALTAWDALEMATVGGAKALGRETGSIAPGLWADLVLLDAEALNLIPCHDAANNIAYAAHGGNVVLNMCRGKVIYENGEFLTIDREKTLSEVKEYAVPLLFGK